MKSSMKVLSFLYYSMYGKSPEHEDIIWLYYSLLLAKKG